MDGGVSGALSGYMDEYDASYFLYDSLRIEDNPIVHAQLIAGAYSTALDLSFEQEASLNAIAQIIANERGIASPSSWRPDTAARLGEGARRRQAEGQAGGTPVAQLGRGEGGQADHREERGLSFRNGGSPEACETAVALFLAKLLAMIDRDEEVRGLTLSS